jgi:Putative zinc-finger
VSSSSGRRFSVSVSLPDWGQDHLSPEAVAAFVDEELAPGPHARAQRHLSVCPECSAQVRAQAQARSALRTAAAPCVPSSLLSMLQSIPQSAELPPAPHGLAVSEDGQLVSTMRALPADAPPAGLDTDRPAEAGFGRGPALGSPRRARLGVGMAAAGLALIALGAAALPSDSPVPSTSADPGVFGGAPRADANLRLPGAP